MAATTTAPAKTSPEAALMAIYGGKSLLVLASTVKLIGFGADLDNSDKHVRSFLLWLIEERHGARAAFLAQRNAGDEICQCSWEDASAWYQD
jgi:hypothetical protein